MSNTIQYRCPNCGGDIAFSPSKQGYECEYCKSFFTQRQIEETYADLETQNTEGTQPDDGETLERSNLYVCNSCGAEIVADAQTSATFCCYCHNPVTLKGRLSGEFKPNRVMPFNIDRSEAESIFKGWCSKKKFTPSDFNSNKTLEKMTGLYVPFWLADCKTIAHFEGLGKRIKTWSDSKYTYTKTDEYHFVRDAKVNFNGIPIDGEKKIDDRLIQAIEPFDYSKLKPFSASYLTGFYADKYDVSKAEAFPIVKRRALDSTLNIVKNDTHYDVLLPNTKDLNILKTDWEYTLMPVWFLNYKYQERFYTFIVNGQSGKVAGILPLSKAKLFGFAVGLTLVLTIILTLIGGTIL